MYGYGNSMFLATHGILARGTAAPAFVGLLDTYSGASAAYSLRRLSSTYTGNAIRVRRSIGIPAEQDIGFVNDVLDTASLLTFCGAGDGFITTWYDQSGNGNNLTQATVLNQPQIVSSGSVINEASKPTLQFDGLNDRMTNSTINITQPITRFIVGKATGTGGFDVLCDSNDSGNRYVIYRSAGGAFYSGYSNAGTQISTLGNANRNLLYDLGNNTTSVIARNGATGTTGNAGTNGLNGLTIGDLRISGAGYILQGNIQEMIIYNSNQSTNRTGIESNINTFYTIY